MQHQKNFALSPRSHNVFAAIALLIVSVSGGCPKNTATAPAIPQDAGAADDDGPARSTFGKGAPSPIAQALCNAIQSLPREAKAKCCDSKPGVLLTGECTRMLGGAVADGAAKVDKARVDACAQAMATLYAGCDWVGARSRPLPEACSAVVQGTRKATQPCRSALECESGLYCHGVSPTAAGKCGPPRPAGGACGRGIDPLMSYVGDNGALHPECEGVCANGKCRILVAIDGDCRANAQCGSDAHCGADKKCHSGFAGAQDKACLGGRCAIGLNCVAGKCRAPKPSGEKCKDDSECLGACIATKGKKAKTCGQRCAPSG